MPSTLYPHYLRRYLGLIVQEIRHLFDLHATVPDCLTWVRSTGTTCGLLNTARSYSPALTLDPDPKCHSVEKHKGKFYKWNQDLPKLSPVGNWVVTRKCISLLVLKITYPGFKCFEYWLPSSNNDSLISYVLNYKRALSIKSKGKMKTTIS